MRLFAAVELVDEVKAAAAEAAARLRQRLGDALDARWIPAENLHITLWFLGEVADDLVPGLLAVLEPPLTQNPFEIAVAGLGAFPPSGPPRVLWIGVSRGQVQLRAIHAALAARLVPLGFEAERRPYSAHLTVARVRRPPRSHGVVRQALGDVVADAGVSPVNSITLFRSSLTSKGARYEPVLRVALKG